MTRLFIAIALLLIHSSFSAVSAGSLDAQTEIPIGNTGGDADAIQGVLAASLEHTLTADALVAEAYARHGNLTEDLATELSAASPLAEFSVCVWFRPYGVQSFQELVRSSPPVHDRGFRDWQAGLWHAQRAAILEGRLRAAQQHPDALDEHMQTPAVARPFVCGEFFAWQIESLAYSSVIVRVVPHDPNPSAGQSSDSGDSGTSYWYTSTGFDRNRMIGLDGRTVGGHALSVGIIDLWTPDYVEGLLKLTALGGNAISNWRADGNVSYGAIADDYRDSSPTQEKQHHAYQMASIMMLGPGATSSDDPIPEAALSYVAMIGFNSTNTWGEHSALEWLVNEVGEGATISRSAFYNPERSCTLPVDSWTLEREWYATLWGYRTLIVQAAGNDGETAECVYYGQNSFLVGGARDHGTLTRTDDTMWTGSTWRNPTRSGIGQIELPHVVAPAVGIRTGFNPRGGPFSCGGTSCAVPMVAATDVQMREYATESDNWFGFAFSLYPEARKAVLMATASQDVDGHVLDWDDFTWDDRDGAGLVNACAAVRLSDVQYHQSLSGSDAYSKAGVGMFNLNTSSCFPWCPPIAKAKIPSGATVKIALNWLVDVDCTWSSGTYNCSSGRPENFNLMLDCPSGVQDSFSYAANSAYEYIEWTNTTGQEQNCNIKIWWYGGTGGGIYPAGIAFMTTSQLSDWTCGNHDL